MFLLTFFLGLVAGLMLGYVATLLLLAYEGIRMHSPRRDDWHD